MIATPANYDLVTQHFDCSSVEGVIELVLKSSDTAVVVIKSTIPVGYTEKIGKGTERIELNFHQNFCGNPRRYRRPYAI